MRLVRIGLFALVGTVALSALAQTIEGQDVDAIRKRSAEMKAVSKALREEEALRKILHKPTPNPKPKSQCSCGWP